MKPKKNFIFLFLLCFYIIVLSRSVSFEKENFVNKSKTNSNELLRELNSEITATSRYQYALFKEPGDIVDLVFDLSLNSATPPSEDQRVMLLNDERVSCSFEESSQDSMVVNCKYQVKSSDKSIKYKYILENDDKTIILVTYIIPSNECYVQNEDFKMLLTPLEIDENNPFNLIASINDQKVTPNQIDQDYEYTFFTNFFPGEYEVSFDNAPNLPEKLTVISDNPIDEVNPLSIMRGTNNAEIKFSLNKEISSLNEFGIFTLLIQNMPAASNIDGKNCRLDPEGQIPTYHIICQFDISEVDILVTELKVGFIRDGCRRVFESKEIIDIKDPDGPIINSKSRASIAFYSQDKPVVRLLFDLELNGREILSQQTMTINDQEIICDVSEVETEISAVLTCNYSVREEDKTLLYYCGKKNENHESKKKIDLAFYEITNVCNFDEEFISFYVIPSNGYDEFLVIDLIIEGFLMDYEIDENEEGIIYTFQPENPQEINKITYDNIELDQFIYMYKTIDSITPTSLSYEQLDSQTEIKVILKDDDEIKDLSSFKVLLTRELNEHEGICEISSDSSENALLCKFDLAEYSDSTGETELNVVIIRGECRNETKQVLKIQGKSGEQSTVTSSSQKDFVLFKKGSTKVNLIFDLTLSGVALTEKEIMTINNKKTECDIAKSGDEKAVASCEYAIEDSDKKITFFFGSSESEHESEKSLILGEYEIETPCLFDDDEAKLVITPLDLSETKWESLKANLEGGEETTGVKNESTYIFSLQGLGLSGARKVFFSSTELEDTVTVYKNIREITPSQMFRGALTSKTRIELHFQEKVEANVKVTLKCVEDNQIIAGNCENTQQESEEQTTLSCEFDLSSYSEQKNDFEFKVFIQRDTCEMDTKKILLANNSMTSSSVKSIILFQEFGEVQLVFTLERNGIDLEDKEKMTINDEEVSCDVSKNEDMSDDSQASITCPYVIKESDKEIRYFYGIDKSTSEAEKTIPLAKHKIEDLCSENIKLIVTPIVPSSQEWLYLAKIEGSERQIEATKTDNDFVYVLSTEDVEEGNKNILFDNEKIASVSVYNNDLLSLSPSFILSKNLNGTNELKFTFKKEISEMSSFGSILISEKGTESIYEGQCSIVDEESRKEVTCIFDLQKYSSVNKETEFEVLVKRGDCTFISKAVFKIGNGGCPSGKVENSKGECVIPELNDQEMKECPEDYCKNAINCSVSNNTLNCECKEDYFGLICDISAKNLTNAEEELYSETFGEFDKDLENIYSKDEEKFFAIKNLQVIVSSSKQILENYTKNNEELFRISISSAEKVVEDVKKNSTKEVPRSITQLLMLTLYVQLSSQSSTLRVLEENEKIEKLTTMLHQINELFVTSNSNLKNYELIEDYNGITAVQYFNSKGKDQYTSYSSSNSNPSVNFNDCIASSSSDTDYYYVVTSVKTSLSENPTAKLKVSSTNSGCQTFYAVFQSDSSLNPELYKYFKNKGVDIYDKDDPVYESCFLSKNFDYDLTQKYRRHYLYQGQNIQSSTESCEYESLGVDGKSVLLKCVMGSSDSLIGYEIVEEQLPNEKEVKTSPLKCVKKIGRFQKNIALYMFPVLVIIIVCVTIIARFVVPDSDEVDSEYADYNIPTQNTKPVVTIDSLKEIDIKTDTFVETFIKNLSSLHSVTLLYKRSLLVPFFFSSTLFLFNLSCIFGFDAVYFSESMIEERIYNKRRDKFAYSFKHRNERIVYSILTYIGCNLLIRGISLVTLSQKNLLISQLKEKTVESASFEKKMLLRRIISMVIMVACFVFFYFYCIVFCGLYIHAQYEWLYSVIWILMWLWIIIVPLYISLISFIEKSNKHSVLTYYLKQLFLF